MELIQRTALVLKANARRPVGAIAAAGLLLLYSAPAHSQDQIVTTCPTEGTWPHQFERATAGDAFVTAEGEEVRIVGVLAPGSDGDNASEAMIAAARTTLAEMIGNRPILLAPADQERDHYGRLVAQIFAGGEWLQAALLRAGWVRAAPDMATESCGGLLLEAEAQARATGAGHWAEGRFVVLQVEQLIAGERRFAGSFQIVEGAIVDVGDFRGRYFPVAV